MDAVYLFQTDDVMKAEKTAVYGHTLARGPLFRATLDQLRAAPRNVPPPGAVPVGTCEFTHTVMSLHGIPRPAPFTYPEQVHSLLGRLISHGRYSDVPAGVFVKPFADVKKFTGHIKGDPAHAPDLAAICGLDGMEVWVSSPVRFVAESRFYVVDNQIVGWSRYDENEGITPDPDPGIAREAVDLISHGRHPRGYSVDIGLTDDGRTLLVECNDGWALGYYRNETAPPEAYAALLAARWQEIAAAAPGLGVGYAYWQTTRDLTVELRRRHHSEHRMIVLGHIDMKAITLKVGFETQWGRGEAETLIEAMRLVELYANLPTCHIRPVSKAMVSNDVRVAQFDMLRAISGSW